MLLDELVQQQSRDRRREEADKQVDVQPQAFAVPAEQPQDPLAHPAGIQSQHGEDGAGLDADGVRIRCLALRYAHRSLGKEKVTRRADRQELGETLDDPQYKRLPSLHRRLPSTCRPGVEYRERPGAPAIT
jgi:hypothetical protein